MKSTSENINIVIIGFGCRAQCYAKEFRLSLGNKVQIVAVVDPDKDNVEKRLKSLNISATVYATAEEMLVGENTFDGIIISSPDDCHLESFRSISHLNKPILLEKPLEGNVDNFPLLKAELLAYNAPILIGHCMRHAPILKKARQIIEDGVIGKVNSMRFVQNCHYGDVFFRGWHRRSEVITSLYLEKASHDFDIMHMLNGDHYATSVFAFSKLCKFGGDKSNDLSCSTCPDEVDCSESILNQDATINGGEILVERVGRDKCVWAQEADIGDDEMCLIEFSNGVHGSYIQTFYTPANYKGRVYTVVGNDGVLDIDIGHSQGTISVHSRYGTKNDNVVYTFDYLGRNHYNGDTYIVRNFLGIIEGKEKPFTTVAAAIAAEEVGLAAVKSVSSRQLEKVNK